MVAVVVVLVCISCFEVTVLSDLKKGKQKSSGLSGQCNCEARAVRRRSRCTAPLALALAVWLLSDVNDLYLWLLNLVTGQNGNDASSRGFWVGVVFGAGLLKVSRSTAFIREVVRTIGSRPRKE